MMQRVCVVLTLAAGIMAPLEAQFGMPPKPRSTPVKVDLEAIKCGVCGALAEHMHERTAMMREEAIGGKIHEDDIAGELEDGACDPSTPLGKWITEFDLVEVPFKGWGKGGSKELQLQRPGGKGHCKEECETIAKSCELLVGEELDVEELVVALWKNKHSVESLKEAMCSDWSDRCSGKGPPAAAADRVDYPFEERTEQDLQMEEIMAQMQAAGMGGPGGGGMGAYSAEDMQDMMGMGNEGGGGMGGFGGMGDGFEGLDDFTMGMDGFNDLGAEL